MTIFDASGPPPILGDEEGGTAGEDDDAANIRLVLGEPASSDSDEVIACVVREGGEGVIAGTRGRPGMGIGGDDGAVAAAAAAASGVETAVAVVLASCTSLASRMAATHAFASSCDSACRRYVLIAVTTPNVLSRRLSATGVHVCTSCSSSSRCSWYSAEVL